MEVAQPDGQQPLMRAAQYIRMSTEHQQYSTENQADIIRDYAAARGYEIVKTYADKGKSGLRVEGREALQQLLADVQAGTADFEAILVYDISRWGRFQDSDEGAYYEHTCKRAGLHIEYCAEQFENDGSPISTIIKGVKRAMAGEYSRELSAKVFKGQSRLIQLGYRQGGPAGFGLQRMLLDQSGQLKGALKPGEQKSLQTDRVVLAPAEDGDVAIVREIYTRFIRGGQSERQISDWLNTQQIAAECGRSWTKGQVHTVLTNEKYIGNNVWNRVSFKLKKRRVVNPADRWIRAESCFAAIIDSESFYTARGIMQERARRFTDHELLERLKKLFEANGFLTGSMIDDSDLLPSSTAYRSRFGNLIHAYELVGYTPERDMEYLQVNRRFRAAQPGYVEDIVRDLQQLGASVRIDAGSPWLHINDLYTASLVLLRCRQRGESPITWLVRLNTTPPPDVTIIARMDATNERPADYYLFPRFGLDWRQIVLKRSNSCRIDTFRFDTLDFFKGMAICQVLGFAA
jgi:DNA invertase Pin-like site-specific DNA recombinase